RIRRARIGAGNSSGETPTHQDRAVATCDCRSELLSSRYGGVDRQGCAAGDGSVEDGAPAPSGGFPAHSEVWRNIGGSVLLPPLGTSQVRWLGRARRQSVRGGAQAGPPSQVCDRTLWLGCAGGRAR